MSLSLKFGENSAFIIVCGILALLAILFFIIVFVADFKESRRKAKKKRNFERAVDSAQRRRQKAH